MTNTLIVGAGITGASICHLLQEAKTKFKPSIDFLVWEKNNIMGGRMMSRSFRQQRDVHVDFGAQYLTTYSEDKVVQNIRNLLRQKNLLIPFEEEKIYGLKPTSIDNNKTKQKHEICPHPLGMRAIVEELLKDTQVDLSQQLDHFELTPDGKKIRVFNSNNEQELTVDNLILTCPPPQLKSILQKSKMSLQNLETIEQMSTSFSQRFALSFLFDLSQVSTCFTQQVQNLKWIARYVHQEEDDHIRYLCWDHLKKNQRTSQYYTLLVHTSVPFGQANMDGKDNKEIVNTIKTSLKKFIPFLPQEKDVLVHRWRVSQAPTIKTTSQKVLVLHTNPHILVAGDVFLGSKFDHCLLSAKETVDYLLTQ